MGWDYESSSSSSCSESSTDMAYGDSSVYSENEEMEGVDEEVEEDLDWYYAVVVGRCRGIFTSWKDALKHTRKYSRATFKKFPTFEEAREFLNQYGLQVDHEYQHFDGSRLWFAYAMNNGQGDFPDPLHPSSIVAFCGGSALRNGDPDCDAAYACVFPHDRAWDVVRSVEGPWPTSYRAEYMAALAALERANVEDRDETKVLFIYSDCKLLIESMSKWIYRWRNNGWRTVDGRAIQNQDLLEKLMAAQGNRRVQWRKVRANSGKRYWDSFWNDIARLEARRPTRGNLDD
ncbi:RNA-DNA hybrid ribonuclease [Phytophthora pseudosyringae]|uniref:ribonuclease H n=1 Tax=Phytophthora pseudosyringae TaxID=221518 RepID=A0A8T1W4Y9_9STRA|nr:RNA-DNA hybrid ribonuclease [Phytophthora pseudosyringae]